MALLKKINLQGLLNFQLTVVRMYWKGFFSPQVD